MWFGTGLKGLQVCGQPNAEPAKLLVSLVLSYANQGANLGFRWFVCGLRVVCVWFARGLNLVHEVCEFLSNQSVNQRKPALVQTRKSAQTTEKP